MPEKEGTISQLDAARMQQALFDAEGAPQEPLHLNARRLFAALCPLRTELAYAPARVSEREWAGRAGRTLRSRLCSALAEQRVVVGRRIFPAGVKLDFEAAAVNRIAAVAAEVNTSVENIGARRLHTVVERLVEDLSFEAADMAEGSEVVITEEFVDKQIGELLKKLDLSKFIL